MAAVAYNIGSDTRVTITVNGTPLGAQIMTMFEAKQSTTNVKSTAITGQVRERELAEGWTIEMEWDRGNSVVDDFFVREEKLRYAGKQPSDVKLLEKTTNPDGSVSRYRYSGVTLKLETAGVREGDKKVTQRASGFASRRENA